jgi:hypothetical protein
VRMGTALPFFWSVQLVRIGTAPIFDGWFGSKAEACVGGDC